MLIKSVTLWSPWGQFMAKGLKKNETRSWYTAYRGPLAIHAAARIHRNMIPDDIYAMAIKTIGPETEWPLGKILCIVDLYEVVKTEKANPSDLERLLGNYEKGRYAWKTSMIKIFPEPIPARGSQRIWEWDWDNSKVISLPKGQIKMF